ncbi:hypothetical protein P7B02_10190 [Caulobacter segnis]|uniref:hypothetical protein n=1 Tax=Caulobacter segnis TaxID=88688 RepID=UPI00240FC02C|nr:hypothetical protein [Caulobacter segnis]MDG2521912.1 hypothetical protein [Caulobacter segnis]
MTDPITASPEPAVTAPASDVDRNLALVVYALLFSSIFFAGIPALIAVVIAYAQRGHADPQVTTHHNFQIRIFWIALVLSLIAAVCGMGGLVAAIGDIFQYAVHGDWSAWDVVELEFEAIRFDPAMIVLTIAAGVFTLIATLWLLCAPAFGFIRLINQRPIGQR